MPPLSVFISYSHDSPEHEAAIFALSDTLWQKGIRCIIDQDEQSPPEGWPLWCDRQIEQASFVLVVCTETYLRRYRGEEAPHTGLGATWEGHIITQELYDEQGKNLKFIPTILRPEDRAFIPRPLRSATVYNPNADFESIYRRLTAQPIIVRGPLGPTETLPPRQPPTLTPPSQLAAATIWHLRHTRSSFFTGRETILTDLRHALESRGAAALTGFGGLGKTQTAVEYAHRHRQSYAAVFWVDADSRETLLAGFASIAAILGLPSADAKEQELAVTEVHRWLESNPGWLLILDNADDLPLAQPFLPNYAHGHLLLTTQTPAVNAIAEPIPMPTMPLEEGALLLLRRAGVLTKDKLLAEADESNRRAALALSKELVGLPLALDQAGAFIEETPSNLSEYTVLFASAKATLLAERGSLAQHASVTATFRLAFGKVTERNPAAADLLRLCAFLAPDGIPEEIFTGGDTSTLGETLAAAAGTTVTFIKLIGEARRFSLLERDPAKHTLSIHRLIQTVIQTDMAPAEQRDWAERTVRAVAKAFPSPEFANWSLCQKLIPHAQTCANLLNEWNFAFVEAAILLNDAAYHLDDRALYAEAEALYRLALAIYEKELGPDHPHVATSLNNLAELYRARGKYTEAEPLYQLALAIREKALGQEHPDVAASLNNLAELCRNQGRYAEAEPLYRRSLGVWEKTLGQEHPYVAISLNNLASLYFDQTKYADAEPLYQRSLAIRKKALGPEHPDVATCLNNLASLYEKQGHYTDAEPLYVQSLAILGKALGPDHRNVVISLNNLASLYDNQGRSAEAEPLRQRALAISAKHQRNQGSD